MGYYPILKTTWKYFPEKKGFLTGLILCVFGLCPFVFTSIADAVINPEGVPANEKGIFDDDKIAINATINQNLEQQAASVFYERFIINAD